MATIKVKRSPESKGRCKLAWNKVYNAEINPSYKDSYIIGNNVYLSKWFTPITDHQPKQKPIVKTDPETGKFVVQKPERDWSKPQAFPNDYVIPKGIKVIALEDSRTDKSFLFRKPYLKGTTLESDTVPMCTWEDGAVACLMNTELAPLNPTDHPEHPEFGKVNRVVNTKDADVTTIDTTGMDQAPKLYKELPIPKPKQDIRDTIAEYVRKYGHELTAIELIGHLTIDKQ